MFVNADRPKVVHMIVGALQELELVNFFIQCYLNFEQSLNEWLLSEDYLYVFNK